MCAVFCCHMISISHKKCGDLQLHFIHGNFVLISWLQFTLRFYLVFFSLRLFIVCDRANAAFNTYSCMWVFSRCFSLSLLSLASILISPVWFSVDIKCAIDVSTFLPPLDSVLLFWLTHTHIYNYLHAHTEEHKKIPTCCSVCTMIHSTETENRGSKKHKQLSLRWWIKSNINGEMREWGENQWEEEISSTRIRT